MVLSAIAVIWRPRDARLFVSMVALQLASVLIQLPGMSNCWMFSGIAGIGILAGAIRVSRSSKPFSTISIYEEVVPFLRVALIAFYSLAALAKYNHDFLNPESSDAAYIAYMFADSFRLPAWDVIGTGGIWGALFFETAIPILLFLPVTRRHGVLLGLFFHTVLAHNPKMRVIDFNAMLFAMYVTFTPDSFARTLWEDAVARTTWIATLVRNRMLVLLSLVGVSAVMIAWQIYAGSGRMLINYSSRLWLVIGCSITIIAYLGLFGNKAKCEPIEKPFRLRSLADFAVIGIVLLNGLSPYLGLKTVVSFTMFSNLRTETGYENHLFIPKWLKCFDLQDHPVQIAASTVPELARYAENGDLLLLYDLQLRAQNFPEHSVTYISDGKEIVVPRISDDPLLGSPLPYLAKKCLMFRPIQLDSKQPHW